MITLKWLSDTPRLVEGAKIIGDFVSGGVVVASLLQWLPVILAVPAAVYACLRIYEWFEKRGNK